MWGLDCRQRQTAEPRHDVPLHHAARCARGLRLAAHCHMLLEIARLEIGHRHAVGNRLPPRLLHAALRAGAT